MKSKPRNQSRGKIFQMIIKKRFQAICAKFLSKTRLLYLPTLFAETPALRVINYHWTPEEESTTLEKQFKFISENYVSLDEHGLRAFLRGKYHKTKNAIIISFDDGFLNNWEIGVPLLEKYRLVGWFFVIGNGGFADGRLLEGNLNNSYCMNWNQLREVRSRGHVIGCHTMNHVDLGKTNLFKLGSELIDSRLLIESKIGYPVSSFAYPYGTAGSFSKTSIKMVRNNYEFGFHNFPIPIKKDHHPHALGRICVESGWTTDILQFRLNGFLDVRYRKPRNNFFKMLKESSTLP
ncbi:polysaccharide deacetylase family protein [Verrucomicrobia bacterium]|nr:polysaccharide deacetylase family protein [Verrucomicrobiota bacterium]